MNFNNLKVISNFKTVIGVFVVLSMSFLMISCKNKESKANKKHAVINKLENKFLGQVGTFDLRNPYLISTRNFQTYNNLSEEFTYLIHAKSIFKNHKPTSQFGLEVELLFSENYRTFVVYQYDESHEIHYKLITYTNNFDYIDAINVSYFDLSTKMNETETYIYKNKLYVHNKITKNAQVYTLNDKGKFEKQTKENTFNYLPLKVYNSKDEVLQDYQKRIVKAKNDLIIRDSLGNKIGKFNFLDIITVLKTNNEPIEIKDNGKIVKGYKAKVINDTNILKKTDNFNISNSNIGYVFTGFLFDEPKDKSYEYSGLTYNNQEFPALDLSELLEITPVNLSAYQTKIVKQTQNKDVTKSYKTNGKVSLTANNGLNVIFKDTIYQDREFSPAKLFSVFKDKDFQNQFIVNYQMIFDFGHFYFIDKDSGVQTDTYFGGYPHVSPNQSIVVSVDYDAECPNQRTLFIDKLVNGKIKKVIQIYFDTSQQSITNFIETNDANEIYWLSNTSFILKFWGATECYDDSNNYFYQKFNLKENLLYLLDNN